MKPVETGNDPKFRPILRLHPRIIVFRPFLEQLPSWTAPVRPDAEVGRISRAPGVQELLAASLFEQRCTSTLLTMLLARIPLEELPTCAGSI